jgi:hypothetical protein
MSDQVTSALIQVSGFLIALIGYLTMNKRHQSALQEKKNIDEMNKAETWKKNNIEVENLRHQNQMLENENFKRDISELKMGIGKMSLIFKECEAKMTEVTVALKATQEQTDKYMKEFNDYKEWNFGRIQQLDHKIMEHDQKFGNVILKT